MISNHHSDRAALILTLQKIKHDVMNTQNKRNRAGNPNFKSHRPNKKRIELVKMLARHGVKHDYIAEHLGISKPTLYKHYKKHIADAVVYAHAKMGQSLFDRALAGDTTAAIFYLKTQAGWKEKVEVTGKDDEPIQHEVTVTPQDKLLNFLTSIRDKIDNKQ